MRIITRTMVFACAWALAAQPAFAANFGSHDCIAIPGTNYSSCISIGNNYNHQWHFTNPRNDIYLDFSYIVENQFDARTELAINGTTFSNADVQVFDADYGDFNVWGWVWCPPTSWTSGGHPYKACRPQWLRFNLYYLTAFDSQLERRYMACHEFGHTLGLRHTGDTTSCMKANVALVSALTTHDISHVNAVYWPY